MSACMVHLQCSVPRIAVGQSQIHASYKVVEDLMKSEYILELRFCGTLDRAIRMIKLKSIVFIFTSPLSQVHYFVEKIHLDP